MEQFKKILRAAIRVVAWAIVVGLLLILIRRTVTDRRQAVKVDQTAASWNKLLLILNNVDENYVDTIDYNAVTEEAIATILSKLDPHSTYLPPEDLSKAEENLMGNFGGIGIEFNVPEDTAIVARVIHGGPSERAGLMEGDRVVTVDGRTIAGVSMPQDTMVKLMRGPQDSKVVIGIRRNGEADILPFEIVRGTIPQKSVTAYYMVNDTTAYIKIEKYARTTYQEFCLAMAMMKQQGATRAILDLRDNLGGFMEPAIKMANEFLPVGDLIVYLEGRHRRREDFYADGRGVFKDVKLAILINDNSASASEIFAGAMQDNDRATIYGRRSFGKGLVQEPINYSDGSGIRLTVARYHTPTGRIVQKPYNDGDEYGLDIYERYAHGEMVSADSIRVDESLKFTTPGGRTVYGGGGITPDVFVPIDTTGVTDFLIACNRKSVIAKFGLKTADKYRSAMSSFTTMKQVDAFISGLNLSGEFLAFAASQGIRPAAGEWEESSAYILSMVKALVGRASPLDEEAFYTYWNSYDNVFRTVLEKDLF